MKPPISFSLISIFAIYLVPSSDSKASPVAIHPERNKFLGEALSWLTLRVQGKPLSGNILEETTEVVREKYRASRLFRTIVIAFQHGVLPKLTLQQGQACDPAYTLLYKNSLNNSVTYEKIRNFTIQNYYDLKTRGNAFSGPYCDSRQGLVCLPTTKKCDCPEGSKMGPIEENSQVQRCLLEEDQPCPLMDFGVSRNIQVLAGRIADSIFNLEKPQSCKWGTQCAVKNTRYPTCMSSSKGPFTDKSPWLKYGEECVLDFIGDAGGCEDYTIPYYPFSTCFNYWGYLRNKRLPSSGVSRLKGFCASEAAPYLTPATREISIGYGGLYAKDYFLTSFVNPRTVQMSLPELLAYDKELYNVTTFQYRSKYRRRQNDVGQPCSVFDTTKLLEFWNFYAGLEKNPSTGQDFVADVATLNTKLAELKNVLGDQKEPKICRVTWELKEPPLICVPTGASPDTKGNDGTCQLSTNNESYPYALSLNSFYDDLRASKLLSVFDSHDSDILQSHPEAVCTPKPIVSNSRNDNAASHTHGEVLEDGNCIDGYACMEDFSGNHGIYEDDTFYVCKFKEGYQPQYFCIDVSSRHFYYDWCEGGVVDTKVDKALETVSKLERGATCNYDDEKLIVEYLRKLNGYRVNGYRLLVYLETNGMCDPSKLLECSKENTCECIANTGVRMSADKKYTSDYCYLTSGSCKTDVTRLTKIGEINKKALKTHYGDYEKVKSDCSKGNICLFLDSSTKTCTSTNTGRTGVDVEETTTQKPGKKPLEPPTYFGGAEMSLKKPCYVGGVFMMIIYLLIST